MANAMYAKGRQGFLDGSIDWDTNDIRVILVDLADYTPDLAAHDLLDDVPAGARVAVSGALANKTVTDGVADADDVTLNSVTGDPCEALLIYQHTGTDGTSRLIALYDGKMYVTIAADASGGATTLWCEALAGAMANGATLTKISGTGPSTLTASAGASADARSISVSAIGSGITAGAVYEVAIQNSGLPVTPNGGDITITWDSGANKIFRL